MKLSITEKIALMAVLLVSLTAGIVTFVFYRFTNELLVEHALDDLSLQIQKDGELIASDIDNLRKQVLFLSGTPPIQGIIRARRSGGLDAASTSTEQQWRDRLAVIFTNMLGTNPAYLQARLIDANGQELVRVDRQPGGVQVTPPQQLQDKSSRDYVRDTLALQSGQVYLSEINLNRELGKVSVPHTPVLRAATPVYDPDGKRAGLLVINLDFSSELQRIQLTGLDVTGQGRQLLVSDQYGGFLVHKDTRRLYGTDLGKQYRVQEEIPAVAPFYLPGSDESLLTLLPEQTGTGLAAVFAKVRFGEVNSGRYIVIGLTQRYEDIVAVEQRELVFPVLLSLALIIAGTVLGTIIISLQIRPLHAITEAMRNIREGAGPVSLPLGRRDEIGILARTFAGLHASLLAKEDELRSMNEHLEDEVERRSEQLLSAEVRNRTILDTVVDGIITIDEKGIVQSFNKAATSIFQYAAEEVIGANIKMLMPEPYHSEHDSYLKNYASTGQAKIIGLGREVVGRRKDGSTFPLDLAVSQMHIAGKRYFTGIVRDITERKRIDTMKSEFVSTVSHELRTPLTSIRGSIGLIRGSVVGDIPDQLNELLDIAYNNTERLLLLINDILDLQKIESGKMPFVFSRVDVHQLLQVAIRDTSMYARNLKVSFRLASEPSGIRVFADRDRLLQVLANLMSNAAKFSPPGSVVELHATSVNGICRVSVVDYGPGIAEDFQDKLFDKFTQHDSSDTRAKGGTGLGLSIAKLIVEKHGGRIGFVSKSGIGTTFYFELPEVIESQAIDEAVTTKLNGKPGATVLIVEDDEDVAAIMRRQLVEIGFNADIAGSVAEAKRLLDGNPGKYLLMTLDILLPDGDGISFMNQLRGQSATHDLPILIVSVKADEARRDINGGAVNVLDWISKPIDEQRLLAAVRSASGPGKLPCVLHVEDDPDIHKLVSLILQNKCELIWTTTLEASRDVLERHRVDLVLLDINLPDGSGIDLLPAIEQRMKPPRVVVFSALDMSSELAGRVDAVLLKSTTSHERLVDVIVDTIQQGKGD